MKTYPYYSLIGYKGLVTYKVGTAPFTPEFMSWFNILNPMVSEDLVVSELKIESADSTTGTLTFTIPASNHSSSSMEINTVVELCGFDTIPETTEEATMNGDPVWIGRIINLSVDIYGNTACTAEGPAHILRNIYITDELNIAVSGPQPTVLEFLELYLAAYGILQTSWENNGKTDVAMPRCLTIDGITTNGYISNSIFNNPISSFDGFECKIGLGGSWSLSYTGDPISIFDWLQRNIPSGFDEGGTTYYYFNAYISSSTPVKSSPCLPHTVTIALELGVPTSMGQTMYKGGTAHAIYGENLISADLEYDWESVATSIAVFGKEIEDPITQVSKRVSITGQSINGVYYQTPYLNADEQYIEKYGIIPKTIINDVLEDSYSVYNQANLLRNLYVNPVRSVSIDAVNLIGYTDASAGLTIGMYLTIDFPGLFVRSDADLYYRCTKEEIDILDPTQNRYHVEYTKSSLTSEISSGAVGGGYSTSMGGSISGGGSSGSEYELPVATYDTLGGIKVGSGLYITPDGHLNNNYSYSLPTASSTILGGVKVGWNLTIDSSGVLKMLYVDAGRRSNTTAGTKSTAEGNLNEASGDYSHAEGSSTTASGGYSHAEGYYTTASGGYSHAEGYYTTASGVYSHAEGSGSTAEGHYSHAEGAGSKAEGYDSHAEGYKTTASGDFSHAEGSGSTAEGYYSHAEGSDAAASGESSHAEGTDTKASGDYSHAEGRASTASGYASHASGYHTEARGKCSFALGQYNALLDGNNWFAIGNGSNNLSNSFSVLSNGTVNAAGQLNSSGADYAEMFEWADGNPDNDDRVGRIVVLDGEYISLANSESDPDDIIGVVSGAPSVSGDSSEDQWAKMYLTDVYGRKIMETVTVPAETDDEGNIIFAEHEETRMKLNPEFDSSKEYIARSKRPEWDYIGLMGKLVVLDDGTASVNNYIKPSTDGIATKSEEKTRFRVMKRLDENHVRIIIL